MSAIFALTLKQPWASLILFGGKDVENRSWPVPSTLPQWYWCRLCGERRPAGWIARNGHCPGSARWGQFCFGPGDGPFPFRLGIHAGARYDDMAWRQWADGHRSGDWPPSHPTPQYPMGVLLGFVTVTGCHHAEDNACLEVYSEGEDTYGREIERFGPCSRWAEPDAWHWTLTDPQPLDEPIPMRGRQKLWRLPEGVAA